MESSVDIGQTRFITLLKKYLGCKEISTEIKSRLEKEITSIICSSESTLAEYNSLIRKNERREYSTTETMLLMTIHNYLKAIGLSSVASHLSKEEPLSKYVNHEEVDKKLIDLDDTVAQPVLYSVFSKYMSSLSDRGTDIAPIEDMLDNLLLDTSGEQDSLPRY